MSDQLKIDNQISLMHVLEDFVLKNIKYSGVGNQTSLHEHLKFCGVDLQEYRYGITELDKKYIYDLHTQGRFKETEQQKNYRTTAVQKIHLAEDENDTVEIPSIDRLPRFYDDILTEIKQFFAYIQSDEIISLKQVEKLRKKAFHTYAMHNDCLNLNAVPIEILESISKNQNGYQQRTTMATIRQGFIQYAEKILFDKEEVSKISSINKATIIQDLETKSIPTVKKALIQQLKVDIKILLFDCIRINRAKKVLLTHANPDQQEEAIFIFNDDEFYKKTRRKLKKRISEYRNKIDEIKNSGEQTSKSMIRKKYTGDSETWLKQHKVQDQTLYQLIQEIVKKNREHSYLKHKN
ncbi:hypothetical protein ACE01U_03375 [Acinetobacter sp. BSP-153]|uniref:hypothetical protein n=1 Tax=Acinetobacter sp. BSP-153 TaxID=3344663 RepID=UPI00376F4F89